MASFNRCPLLLAMVKGVNLDGGLHCRGEGIFRHACKQCRDDDRGGSNKELYPSRLNSCTKWFTGRLSSLTAQVGVTGGGLDLEDTLLDGQQGHIKLPPSRLKAKADGGSIALVDTDPRTWTLGSPTRALNSPNAEQSQRCPGPSAPDMEDSAQGIVPCL
ncbi:hypothetical protein DFH07DRAFT_780183 [Mycena maculata]|uniref:Uncharacterized protein n=1 Tax=Mycena maculata TaxID=230809 RepID=A0AAD7I431_9AGAR|nr:hypothetical protein DFH07DRAFT_780183 [Mycena maculata]